MADSLLPTITRETLDRTEVEKFARKVARKGGRITDTITCGHEGDTVQITVEWS